ncbi:DUF3320 domain-containing protein [Rhodococcus aetherivorans]|uniref:DUF3320 domain-containing protein n=1 Tax=Rhodococcus aetherivorans TaxID=191292 RepID=UPI001E60E303|nr:DUF3320 domain-containing protein [Rhodococcus aetherivorans]UGQ39586.1 DUF3320 domain-containing protein [Rhodococcus aetherivorans]
MLFDPKLSVSAGLDHLADRLNPIIAAKFATDLPDHPWTVVLTQLDQLAGKPPKLYSATDLQCQLKMFTRRLGKLGYPFDDNRQTVGTLGRELTIVRNARAHGDPFTCLDAWRAHDYCFRLLEHFGDKQGLERSNELRQEALVAYVEEQGIAPAQAFSPSQPIVSPESEGLDGTNSLPNPEKETEYELVSPDPEVFIREPVAHPSIIGNTRLSFQPWEPVLVGDISVLDDLPKMTAKQKVRAVAIEIVEAEGPIHVDRLAQHVATSFGVRKLYSNRATKIIRQAKSAGLLIDGEKFVWPEGVTPETWMEFRPNSNEVDRPFQHISPTEIANAMRFLKGHSPNMSDEELNISTLRTFGRKRRTKQCAIQLEKAIALLRSQSTPHEVGQS